jgi:hypothetical protein
MDSHEQQVGATSNYPRWWESAINHPSQHMQVVFEDGKVPWKKNKFKYDRDDLAETINQGISCQGSPHREEAWDAGGHTPRPSSITTCE